jgi:RNA polymerase sigma-70 factor, ECF subfamily
MAKLPGRFAVVDPSKSSVHALKHITETEDGELIAGALQGSESAFATLIDRYKDRVFRLLSRYCRDPMECEDLAQDVFLKVFRKLHTFQQDSAFYTWLYRIAVNTATDHLSRAQRRRLRLVEDDNELDGDTGDQDDRSSSTEQPLLDAELAEVTRLVLARLPEKYRTILILREYEDLSYTEMAQVLECNLGTVESRLFRARQRFKEALERLYPDLVPGPGRPTAAAPRQAADPGHGRGGNR